MDVPALVGQDHNGAMIAGIDAALCDPTNAGILGEKPPSIFNGCPVITTPAATMASIDTMLGALSDSLTSNGNRLTWAFWVMTSLALSFLCRVRGTGGVLAYPNLDVRTGGSLFGLPVFASTIKTRRLP